jgi:hypothetical protein
MNEDARASLLEIANLLRQRISIPVKTNAGIGAQFRYRIVGPWILVQPVSRDRKNPFQARTEVTNLLEEFYSHHKPKPFGARLILRRIGVFGGFLLSSHDSDIMDILSPEAKEEQTSKHLAEFQRIGVYIAHRFNKV